jgi:hypothetical protein
MTKSRRIALWSAAAAFALGTATTLWLVRGRAAEKASTRDRDAITSDSRDPRILAVQEAARQPRSAASRQLVQLYAEWANDPKALPVRKLVLDVLADQDSLPLRLKGLLEAAVADQTPPERDPLWPEIVQNLAEQWTPETYDKGRDLMLMEQRPRARRALVESFTEFADGDQFANLTEEQRQALINDLIDIYPQSDPQQKSQIEATLRKIAGDDVADLLAGRGVHDGHKLKIVEKYERELQTASTTAGQ